LQVADLNPPDEMRQRLFNSVINDVIGDFRVVYDELSRLEVQLANPEFRDPVTGATALHVALIRESWDIGEHIIRTTSDMALLTDRINYRQEQGKLAERAHNLVLVAS